MLRSGDAVSPRLKFRKITGLSPNHGQITTLPGRSQFVGNKPGMLPNDFIRQLLAIHRLLSAKRE